MSNGECKWKCSGAGFAAGFFLVLATILPTGIARADTLLFSDDFSGSTLNPAWQILPGQGSYSVGGGNLRYFNGDSQASTTGWNNAALTLALPFSGTDWEVDTKATYNLHWCTSGNYTGPSTPNQGCSSGAQGPEAIVKFNPGTTTSGQGGPNYAGLEYVLFERDIDAYYGSNILVASNGVIASDNVLNPADSNINNNVADGTYWLRFVRSGGTVTMNYSYDGITYFTALTTTLSNPSDPYNELLLGGVTWQNVGSYTDYDFVNIKATTPAAEPGSLLLLGCGFAALGLKYRFRRAAGLAQQEALP